MFVGEQEQDGTARWYLEGARGGQQLLHGAQLGGGNHLHGLGDLHNAGHGSHAHLDCAWKKEGSDIECERMITHAEIETRSAEATRENDAATRGRRSLEINIEIRHAIGATTYSLSSSPCCGPGRAPGLRASGRGKEQGARMEMRFVSENARPREAIHFAHAKIWTRKPAEALMHAARSAQCDEVADKAVPRGASRRQRTSCWRERSAVF
jgi:hypothetical protein